MTYWQWCAARIQAARPDVGMPDMGLSPYAWAKDMATRLGAHLPNGGENPDEYFRSLAEYAESTKES